ncbi:hypothetical protein Hanom_Chr11g00998291 [Helianthus anomalus]
MNTINKQEQSRVPFQHFTSEPTQSPHRHPPSPAPPHPPSTPSVPPHIPVSTPYNVHTTSRKTPPSHTYFSVV